MGVFGGYLVVFNMPHKIEIWIFPFPKVYAWQNNDIFAEGNILLLVLSGFWIPNCVQSMIFVRNVAFAIDGWLNCKVFLEVA